MKHFHFILIFSLFAASAVGQSRTKVVLLGTGTPNADPDRFGPSVAIVVDETPYIIDCGPGVVRRAAAANKYKGIAGLKAESLSRLFITHLHSDHTTGYPDILLTPAVLERKEPLQVFGPVGTKDMHEHIEKAYAPDFHVRIFGLEKGDSNAYKTEIHEIKEGLIYEDKLVKVEAFLVPHGGWNEAYAFRFTTPDRKIVVSGDCTFSQKLAEMAAGCDILIHEVYSEDGWSRRPPKWKTYHKAFHTSTTQLAEVANRAKPRLLVLYHQLIWDSTEAKLLTEIRSKYPGQVVSGKDLDVFE